jgi:hypothetical protein
MGNWISGLEMARKWESCRSNIMSHSTITLYYYVLLRPQSTKAFLSDGSVPSLVKLQTPE